MATIKSLGLKNFRIFKDATELEFAPLTILTGCNNSGKSSIIKAMLLLSDNFIGEGISYNLFKQSASVRLNLNKEGQRHNLVSCSRIANNESDDDIFSFSIKVEFSDEFGDVVYDSDGNDFSSSPYIRDELFFDYGVMEYVISYKVSNSTKFNFHQFKLIAHQQANQKPVQLIDFTLEEEGMGSYTINLHWFFENYHKLTELITDVHKKAFKPKNDSDDRFEFHLDDNELKKNGTIDRRDAIFYNTFAKKPGVSGGYDLCYENLKHDYTFYLNAIDSNLMEFLLKEGFAKKIIFKFIDDLCKTFFSEKRQVEYVDDAMGYSYLLPKSDISDILLDAVMLNNIDVKDLIQEFEDKVIAQSIVSKISEYLKNRASAQNLVRMNNVELYNLNTNIYFFFNKFLAHDFGIISKYLTKLIKSDYIEAVRANQQYIYLFQSQGTSFNKLLLEMGSIANEKRKISFLSKWVKEFKIGDSVKIEHLEYGHLVKLIKDGKEIDLIDFGYGTTQLLPIMMKIVLFSYPNKFLIIEEPETNLHPNFQSKLADLFWDAYNTFGIRFVIETHSEYLIRKLQYLTASADCKMNPSHTAIHYFYPPKEIPEGKKQVERINITEHGRLNNDFGEGFFDEASRLIGDLWRLQLDEQNRKN